MKKLILLAAMMASTQVFANINPTILTDSKVQAALNEYVEGGGVLVSLKLTSPSANVVKMEVEFGYKMNSMKECRFVELKDSKVESVGAAIECE